VTAIIGFDMRSCALLIADTRKTRLDDAQPREDGDLKIQQVGFGMVTGAGTRGMLTAIARKLLDPNLYTARSSARPSMAPLNSWVRQGVRLSCSRTGWAQNWAQRFGTHDHGRDKLLM
jgi:hypothetical protein